VNYAAKMNKPMILLKEKNVSITSPREWVEFSKYDSPDLTLKIITRSIQAIQNRIAPNPVAGALIGIGILAFLAAVFSSGNK
jgi:hypothetical protein